MAENLDQNLVILDVEEDKVVQEDKSFGAYLKGLLQNHGKITLREKVVFFRIMATMTNASMTVLKSLETLRRQEKAKHMLAFYDFVIKQVQSGNTLNDSLRSYYGNFTDAECSIIEAGERTGKLNQGLLQVADQAEKMDSIARKVKGAMTYPIVLMVGMVGVVAVIMVKVIPSLLVFFGDPSTLPDSTKLILAISTFIQNYWIHVIILLVILYFVY